MTLAMINAYIKHANAAVRAGDCAAAEAALRQAWLGLGEYSAAIARRRLSPATAVSAHRAISKALVQLGKRCGVSTDPNALLQPSGQSTGYNPDLLAPSGARAGLNPDLVPPSFSGPGDMIYNSVTTTLATLGIAGACAGLGIGLYTVFHKS